MNVQIQIQLKTRYYHSLNVHTKRSKKNKKRHMIRNQTMDNRQIDLHVNIVMDFKQYIYLWHKGSRNNHVMYHTLNQIWQRRDDLLSWVPNLTILFDGRLIGSISIRYRTDTFASDIYRTDIDPKIFAVREIGILCVPGLDNKTFFTCIWVYMYL